MHLSSVGAYSPGPDPDAPGGPRVTEEWPTDGIDSLAYSIEKVAAERLLDDHERHHPDGTAVARMRPGLIVQRDAGSALLRYGMPAYLPAALLRHVPLLPLDRDFVVALVHTDDVADAVARALERRATGAFNLAADLAWRLRLQPLDAGWIDLAFAVPLLDTTRARTELGWSPTVDARTALAEVLTGMADAAATASPALRPRSVAAELSALARRGPIVKRPLP